MTTPFLAAVIVLCAAAVAVNLRAALQFRRAATACKIEHTVALVVASGDGDPVIAETQTILALPGDQPALTFRNETALPMHVIGIAYEWCWPAVQLDGDGAWPRDAVIAPGDNFLVRLATEVEP